MHTLEHRYSCERYAETYDQEATARKTVNQESTNDLTSEGVSNGRVIAESTHVVEDEVVPRVWLGLIYRYVG